MPGYRSSQTAIAWAMTKGVQPIIGATKPHHVTEAAQVGDTRLTPPRSQHWSVSPLPPASTPAAAGKAKPKDKYEETKYQVPIS